MAHTPSSTFCPGRKEDISPESKLASQAVAAPTWKKPSEYSVPQNANTKPEREKGFLPRLLWETVHEEQTLKASTQTR